MVGSLCNEKVYIMCNSQYAKSEHKVEEDIWSLERNHLLKELTKWSDDYINLVGGIDRFEELKRSLLVDGLSMV